MKISKIIMPIALTSATIAPTIAITSCSFNKEPTQEVWAQYIYDRTFSIMGAVQTGYVCWGTCWILSDATPSNPNDYVYNIVTNWHVMKGIEGLKDYGSPIYYFYGCNTKSSGLEVNNDYINFKTFTKYDDSYFTYNNLDTITTTEYVEKQGEVTKTGKRGCDIHVAKADFSNFATSSSPSASIAKNKLNRLNKLTAEGKKITELAETTTDSSHFEDKKMYTAGYPVKNEEYATWEKHDLSSEHVTLEYNTGTQSQQKPSETHWSDSSSAPLTDCSPQYIGTNVGTSWMTGGASGSMLIGNFGTDENPEFKVCGIYWGGAGNYYSFFPYYSIFNSSWKNYLSQWM